MKNIKPMICGWKPRPGSGWQVGIRLFKMNSFVIFLQISLAALVAVLFFVPPFFLKRFLAYLEDDPERLHRGWGIVFALGLGVISVVQSLGERLLPRSGQAQIINATPSAWSTLVHQYHNSPG